jgi:hypothetical protein
MFDRVRIRQLNRWLKRGYQGERCNPKSFTYGHRFALAGLAILVVVGLFVIAWKRGAWLPAGWGVVLATADAAISVLW